MRMRLLNESILPQHHTMRRSADTFGLAKHRTWSDVLLWDLPPQTENSALTEFSVWWDRRGPHSLRLAVLGAAHRTCACSVLSRPSIPAANRKLRFDGVRSEEDTSEL